MAKKIVKKP